MKTKRMLKGILGLIFAAGLTAPAWAAPAVVEKGTGDVYMEVPAQYFECVGEYVTEVISGTASYHRVQLPNGDYKYHDFWFKDITSILTGVISGRQWMRTTQVNPYTEHYNAEDGTLHIHWASNVLFKAVTPDTLDIRVLDVSDYSIDGNGDVSVRFWWRTCLSDGDHFRYEPMASGE
ncbi:MAG: hypothetical protein AB9869_33585 [Verrucomicrobiia bacterium]